MKGLVFDSSCITNIGSSRKLSSLVVQCTRGSLNLCVPALVLTEAAGADVVTAEAAFHVYRLCQEIPSERMFVAPIDDNAVAFGKFRSKHAVPLDGNAHAAYEAMSMFWGLVSMDKNYIDSYREMGAHVIDARDRGMS